VRLQLTTPFLATPGRATQSEWRRGARGVNGGARRQVYPRLPTVVNDVITDACGHPPLAADQSCVSALGPALLERYDERMTEKLRSEALGLPAAERAELAHALLESLHGESDPDAEATWLAELDRRAQAVADGTAQLVDWDDARQRIAARLRARREARAPR